MLVSEAWLREWVNPDLGTEEIIKRLTMAGLEVDGSEKAAGDFSGVVVGEVLSVAKHPDADKLSVCQVSDGKDSMQVVCGAANVRAGLKVPFARVGAQLGEDFKIKKAKLRGVDSNGMLCSAEELGLAGAAESAEGLLELPGDAPAGRDLRDYLKLDDTLIEVDLTPNRGDCLGIAGLARELGVLSQTAVSEPEVVAVAPAVDEVFPVRIEERAGCPRYLGRIIRNINQNVATPLWMQEKLRRCGLRSIDPVVDVTNYILLEWGQPMHAFDYGRLSGGITVRNAGAGEKLVLLDDKEVTLAAGTLVIADDDRALAMAGVMGGRHSAVGPGTKDIFLECAFFAPAAIAGKARAYGLHTDSSHRFERGVDWQLQHKAMERATALLLDIVGGQAGPVSETTGDLPAEGSVRLRKTRIGEVLGMSLPDDEVLDILRRLGIAMAGEDAFGWTFAIPSWRFDISIEEDLIEELARVHGYDNLPVTTPRTPMHLRPDTEIRTPLDEIKQNLAVLGYQEVVTYSFVDAGLNQQLADARQGQGIPLANPISQDMAVMRSTLWPGLIKTLLHNQNRQQTRARLFETGLIFYKLNNKIEQKVKVGCLLAGEALPEQWGERKRPADFYDLKGDLEVLLDKRHEAGEFRFVAAEHPALQPGQTARLMRGDECVGWLGALHPRIAQELDIAGKVLLAEVDYEMLSAARIPVVSEISRYPAVRRDLAVVLDEGIEAAAVSEALRKAGGEALREVGIFDLYTGQNIEKGKKSLALGLTFQHPSRTLSDSEINPIIDSCIKALEALFNAELR